MSTSSITIKTRMVLQDAGTPFVDQVLADGNSNVFDLQRESISSTAYPPRVIVGGNLVAGGGATPNYLFDYKHGVLVMATPPPVNTSVAVQGIYYDYWTDEEIAECVSDAFSMHTNGQDPTIYLDPQTGQTPLPVEEEILVAFLAAIEALWFEVTASSREIDVHTPEGVSIPRSERFRQLTQQIAGLQGQYTTWGAALGVGLYRIQVMWQRRVSLTTNRYVPIYKSQEYNAPYTGFTPTTGVPGTIVLINGMYFTGTTAVTFGGVPASQFTVIDDKTISVTVPVAGQTGQIGITTQYGTALTSAQFVVGAPPPFILFGPEQLKIPIPSGD